MNASADLFIAQGLSVSLAAGEGKQEVRDLGCLGVVGKLWDELGLSALLDSQIAVEEEVQLPPGLALKALVLNIIGGRDPLYRVQDWADGVPLDLVVGKGVRAEQLNDTTLARHLDRLFDAGGEGVFNAACMRVIEREGIDTGRVHADTTSRLVFGEYLREDDEAISITRGHSKDKRPDLKQMMYGLTTSTDGVPLAGQLLSGNTSDKKWHGGMLDVVNQMLVVNRKRSVHYIGDSALVTSANLGLAAKHGIVLTARIPRNVTLCRTTVERALNEPLAMTALGTFAERKGATTYEGCVVEKCELFGHQVQVGVFRPTPSNELAKDKVARRQRHALEDANKDASMLTKRRFGCETDARSSLSAFECKHKHRLLSIKGDVVAETIEGKRSPGRPRKGTVVSTTTQHRVTLTIEADDAGRQAAIDEESIFVLVHTGTTSLQPKEMLAAYKGQIVVEKRFPFLKDPAWAEVFFIKTPHRLEALGYVLLLALLVWCVWERRVRANLKASGEPPLIDTTKMPKKNPTAMVCRHIMASVKLMRRLTDDGSAPWKLVRALTAEQRRVVRFSERPGSEKT
jgi:transposase